MDNQSQYYLGFWEEYKLFPSNDLIFPSIQNESVNILEKDERILNYLRNGCVLVALRGFGTPRACRLFEGKTITYNSILTDGTYVWSDAYVRYYDLGLITTIDFVRHVCKNNYLSANEIEIPEHVFEKISNDIDNIAFMFL